jgi:molecular chaperone DnaK
MSLKSVRWGIDLGTTNSEIAWLAGDHIDVGKDPWENQVMPSAVAFSGEPPEALVGRPARYLASQKPFSVAQRFKRHMGDPGWAFEFPGTNIREQAFELSAKVLRELAASVSPDRPLGAAVVTVPAAFDEPQKDDTYRAGELAGIGHVELLQEPVAAALAFAHAHGVSGARNWLAYDLGGGTFDAALIRGEEGTFTVIDHEGHGQLGGSDFDVAIVRELVLPQLPRRVQSEIERRDRAWGDELRTLAELAKCEISRAESAEIRVKVDDFDRRVTITRREIASLEAKLFGITVGYCRDLLARNHLVPRDIERILLIGGPTLSPSLRAMLSTGWGGDGSSRPVDGLGIPLDTSVDPFTAVASGAAYFAAGLRYEAEEDEGDRAAAVLVDLSGLNPQTPDEAILTAGRVMPRPGHDLAPGRGWSVRFLHLARAGQRPIREASAPLAEGGGFSLPLALDKGENLFRLAVTDAAGCAVSSTPATTTFVRGVQTAPRALVRGIGVADHTGRTTWVVSKGEPLPVCKTESFWTTRALRRGESGEALAIPIVEGNEEKAHLNRRVYTLRILAENLAKPLPEGSLVEVEISMDQSEQLGVTARLPDHNFDMEPRFEHATPRPEEVQQTLDDVVHDLRLLDEVKAEDAEIAALQDRVAREGLLERVRDHLARNGHGSDSVRAARTELEQLQRWIDPHLEQLDGLLHWRKHREYCDRNMGKAAEIVRETAGLPQDWLHTFGDLQRRYREALDRRDEEASQHMAYTEMPELFTQNERLRERVGGPPSAKDAAEQRRTGHLLTGDVQRA